MFSALRAEMGDWQRRVSNPSKDVSIIGYASKSSVKRIIALRSVYKFTLLRSSIGPVSHNPSGITTLPPPLAWTALIASLIRHFELQMQQYLLYSPEMQVVLQ